MLQTYMSMVIHQQIIFPIDPFQILSESDIVYQFREFKDLEGIYLVPVNSEDIPIVGINKKRLIQRQRFTAAHEFCHHIKDRFTSTNNILCPINYTNRDEKEKYADQFATELLMPRGYFEK